MWQRRIYFFPSEIGHFCLRWYLCYWAPARGHGLTAWGRARSVLQQATRQVCGEERCQVAPLSWEAALSSFGRWQCWFSSVLLKRFGPALGNTTVNFERGAALKLVLVLFIPIAEYVWSLSFRRAGLRSAPTGFHWIFECSTHQLVQKVFHGLETLWLNLIHCILSSSSRRTAVEEPSLPPAQKGKSVIHQHCNRSIILSIQWPLGCQWKKLKNLKSREKPNTVALTLHTLWMSHHCVNQVSKTEQSHNVSASSVLKSMAEFLLIFGISIFLDF